MALRTEFALPPLEMFRFLAPLSVQVLLLHPVFPATLSRSLRLALTPVSLYYCWHATKYGFEPLSSSVGLNFVLGVMESYGMWKAIEWGTAVDLTRYTFVGFDETDDGKAVSSRKDKAELHKIRAKQAEGDSPVDILRWTGLLLISMRGFGWAYGPSPKMTSPFLPNRASSFVPRILFEILRSHVTLVVAGYVLLLRSHGRMHLIESALSRFLPSLSPSKSTLYIAGEALGTAGTGIGAFAGLTLGFSIASLLSFTILNGSRVLLPASISPKPFDARHYPPLFQAPWRIESVAKFWAQSWHSFFSPSFTYLGMEPFSALGTRLGGKQVGRAVGVMAVFILSAWLHEHALWTATRSWPYPADAGFITRWGSTLYFVTQGVAVVLQGAFIAATGRKPRGVLGGLWGVCVVGGLGYLVFLSWGTAGLFNNLPEPQDWAWQRYFVPLAVVGPPQLVEIASRRS